MATLAENPTLKAAIDTYRAELTTGRRRRRDASCSTTIEGELRKIADRTQPDVLAVQIAGRRTARRRRPPARRLAAAMPARSSAATTASSSSLPSGVFRVASAPIALHDVQLGRLELATALDEDYARELSELSGAPTVIASRRSVIASTLPADAAAP